MKIGTIKSSKDQALAVGVLNPSKGKKKSKVSKHQDKKMQEVPKYLDGVLNPCKDKEKKKQEKTKFTYYHEGWHPESACMKKTIEMMV